MVPTSTTSLPAALFMRYGRWLIILPPLLFLLVFFLIPFAFSFKISFAETALHVPPYTDLVTIAPNHHISISLNFDNYRYLFTDRRAHV